MQKLQPLVRMTPAAQQRLTRVLKDEKAEDSYLRIDVYETGGCACSGGYRYGMSLEKTPRTGDLVENIDGLKVMVEAQNAELIRGSKIDFYETLQRTGFKIENPNVHAEACGCGEH